MESLNYRIRLEPEPEGGFTVTVPALPGCVTWGRDYVHALEMAQDAIQCYLASLIKDGLPIPIEEPPNQAVETVIQVKSPMAA